MSELLDNRPVFTIVMGCNGAGKSAWKRLNYDRLPYPYIDQDGIAGGFGDWNNERNRQQVRHLVDEHIEKYVAHRLDWGMESTFSGRPGVAMVDRVQKAGYRIEGIYIGTDDPQINIDRIKYRVFVGSGHHVDPERIPNRYSHSLSNLYHNLEKFDDLELIDNSSFDGVHHLPVPIQQCRFESGKPVEGMNGDKEHTAWVNQLLQRLERRLEHEAKLRSPAAPRGP